MILGVERGQSLVDFLLKRRSVFDFFEGRSLFDLLGVAIVMFGVEGAIASKLCCTSHKPN